jgi:hypothetical protein
MQNPLNVPWDGQPRKGGDLWRLVKGRHVAV